MLLTLWKLNKTFFTLDHFFGIQNNILTIAQMNKIKIKPIQFPKELEITINDLREPNHIEFENYEDVKNHFDNAIKQNGVRYHSDHIFQDIYERNLPDKPISFIHHLYHLIGNAKGVIKFRFKHSKSTYSRYKKHQYETLDMLRNIILLKHKGEVYKMFNGFQRVELIDSVNSLCENIDNPKVLEAGCGSGLNIYLLNSLNSNLEIHGFEYTNTRIASAFVNLFYSPIRNNLFLADVCNLNLPDNSYDVVYSNHVLEQLGQENAEKALKEMWRVCKKGIVLSEPSIHDASVYEKWRMKTLGYCKDLYSIAKELPNAKVLYYSEDKFRTYPNTSHHLVVEKVNSKQQ